MGEQDSIAVIGAGVIGAAVAFALSREGRRAVLIDRAEPGVAGASFGNVGHIAAELVQPLPSPQLLFGFWRQLTRFGGVLDLKPSQVARMLPWIRRFAAAAFHRDENTRHLAPLVMPACAVWSRWVEEVGQPDLLRRHGHYEVSFGPKGSKAMAELAAAMGALGIKTQRVADNELEALKRAAGQKEVSGLWFKDSGHVLDPLTAVRTLAAAAVARGAVLKRLDIKALAPRGDRVELHCDQGPLSFAAAVVCAGMGSESLLAGVGVHAPLQGVRGYHIEIPGAESFLDAPVVYADQHMVVTPMAGRLRASSYMEFAPPDAPADPDKPAQLRRWARSLGYPAAAEGPFWLGARPVLPDYLPGIGRAPGPAKVFYAIGHQHIGLTMAPMTGDVMADIIAERTPRVRTAAFDLQRFGTPKRPTA